MLKIKKDNIVLSVLRPAYESVYKKQGFEIINEDKKAIKSVSKTNEKTSNENFLTSILEKPISNWNKKEVIKFSKLKNIEIGDKTVDELKGEIKLLLDEEQKANSIDNEEKNSEGENSEGSNEDWDAE